MEHFGLEIENIVGYHDTQNKKPHPEPILRAISNAGVDKENVISFGDNLNDILASKSAGVKAVGCSWGLKNNKNDFHNLCEFVFDNTLELKIFLEKEYVGDSSDKEKEDWIEPKYDILEYLGVTKGGKRHGQGTSTYADGGKYLGEWKDGKRHGQGTYSLADGGEYFGEWKDDKPHGQGTYTSGKGKWEGSKYLGEWKDGKKNGQGTYTSGKGKWEGNKYVGEFRDDKKHGQGTSTYADGNKYVGEWKDGKKHGQGTYSYANGNKYVGEWKDGKKHGQGTYASGKGTKVDKSIAGKCSINFISDDGHFYDGDWKDDKRHGEGVFMSAFSGVYVGEYKYDKRHGEGTYSYDNGAVYRGEYRDDKKHGQGTYTYADGNKYVGEWKDGKKHGQGTYASGKGTKVDKSIAGKCSINFISDDGHFYDGDWKDDKRHGEGVFMSAFSGVYVGEYKYDKRHGEGTYSYDNGAVYEGEYRDDKKHGQGTYSYDNGAVYRGEYRDDKKHGQGTYTYADGDEYVGEWKDGKRIVKKQTRRKYDMPRDILRDNVSTKYKSSGVLESSYSCYYIPKEDKEATYDKISKELLNFKKGINKSIEFWKNIVKQQFENKSYDYVVRVLSSKELKALGSTPLDELGETIASLTGASYVKSVLRKKRSTKQLKLLNKKERENEISDVYYVSSDLDLSNKKVLIIDDVTTTGTTIKAVAKALKQHTQSIKLHSYCLCKTKKRY